MGASWNRKASRQLRVGDSSWGLGVGPTYLHKRGHSKLFLVMRSWLRRGVVFWCVAGRRLRGIGPALAGNVGTGSAFARPRDGDQGVDVPMLAPARSRSASCSAGPVSLRRSGGSMGVGWTALGVGPTYLHKRGHSQLFLVMRSGLRRGVVFWCVAGRRLRGNGPALAGNVGTGSAFARPRDGDIRVSTFQCSLRPGPAPLRGGAGRLGEGEAFGAPQRGIAYQPGVKPWVWRTNGAF